MAKRVLLASWIVIKGGVPSRSFRADGCQLDCRQQKCTRSGPILLV